VRTREYCTSPKHIITMCLSVVKAAIDQKNFMHVQVGVL
jgi:COP9 signalosome complex subunit 1